MKREVIGRCPICTSSLSVTELSCHTCSTKIQGHFDLCQFCRLPEEQRAFALTFIKNRGNIKEIEKELGISYPTVRNKLDELVYALGFAGTKAPAIDKQEVLRQLADGEITKDEALRKLSGAE